MQDPLGPLRVVLVGPGCRDAALDPDMDVEAYVASRDPALIKIREGARATVFHLIQLDRSWFVERVDSCDAMSTRLGMAFLGACHRIELAAGGELKTRPKTGPYGQKVADHEWLTEVASKLGLRAVYEVGSVAWQRAQLPDDARAGFTL